MTVKLNIRDGKIYAESPYHPALPSPAKKLGGKWQTPYWVFDERDDERVRAMYKEIYGTDGDDAPDLVTLRITVKDEPWSAWRTGVFLAGRLIARATERDSGAILGNGVVIIEGKEPTSGGSLVNWSTIIREGTVLELRDVPRAIAKNVMGADYLHLDFELLDNAKPAPIDREALAEERARLVARIAVIDELLDGNT